jgi:glycosyltransferase involved in cell wall biosynthesis
MARLLIEALERRGHVTELAARLRSHDRSGDSDRQSRLAGIGGRLAARFVDRIHDRPFAERPQVWVTYHLYYKAPDWIGPRVAAKLGIPYIVLEASVADKRAGSAWGIGHAATVAALGRAAAVVSLNPADEPGIAPHVPRPDRLHRMKPFLDATTYLDAARQRAGHRAEIARRYKLDPERPWLLAVAMMRHGDKLDSYKVLGDSLTRLLDKRWTLLVAGDGPARAEVEDALSPLGRRVSYLGALPENELPPLYAASDVMVWPAVNEAYGMAILEAQAAGLPVVAGAVGGVGEIVADGRTGLLVKPRDAAALAAAVGSLLDEPSRRHDLSHAALSKIVNEHDLPAAAARLDDILAAAMAQGAPV